MVENTGIQELTFDEIEAVSGAGWWTDFCNWMRDHFGVQAEAEGDEERVKQYEIEFQFTWTW